MQLVGRECRECHERVWSEPTALGCAECALVLHRSCTDDPIRCPDCDQDYTATSAREEARENAEAAQPARHRLIGLLVIVSVFPLVIALTDQIRQPFGSELHALWYVFRAALTAAVAVFVIKRQRWARVAFVGWCSLVAAVSAYRLVLIVHRVGAVAGMWEPQWTAELPDYLDAEAGLHGAVLLAQAVLHAGVVWAMLRSRRLRAWLESREG